MDRYPVETAIRGTTSTSVPIRSHCSPECADTDLNPCNPQHCDIIENVSCSLACHTAP